MTSWKDSARTNLTHSLRPDNSGTAHRTRPRSSPLSTRNRHLLRQLTRVLARSAEKPHPWRSLTQKGTRSPSSRRLTGSFRRVTFHYEISLVLSPYKPSLLASPCTELAHRRTYEHVDPATTPPGVWQMGRAVPKGGH